MRHGKRFNHLSRTSAHRKAMLANMASSLIIHKRIKTTVAKAKALRTYIEPLITKSKTDSTHSRRVVFSYLKDKDAVTELFREVSVKIADRPGGYTRIIKIGARMGDNAEMALIELVDYNENLLGDKAKGPKKSRRRRSSKKQEGEAAVVAEQAAETVEEVVEDTAEEVKEEAVAETSEEVKEEPKPEAKEEAKPTSAEATADKEAVAEAKEEVKPTSAEATADKEAVAEVKEEPEEEVKEESKAEEKEKEEAVEEVKEEPKAEEKPEEEEKPASDEATADEGGKDKKE
ncbi:MAG: 50S ribosomal protein L17 [Bacteroidales bacterium]|nr:50S ribosomal protein L17 [Bacteroidales bacterium]